MTRYIVGLDSRLALKKLLSGGKGSSLAWLRRQGFPVPPGYVITSRAFDDLLTDLGHRHRGHGPTGYVPASSTDELTGIRAAILAYRMPGRLAARIGRSFARIGGPVAARSSMIGEDGQQASFAGQLDTVLNVADVPALLSAVKRCWASVFNQRLTNYLEERDTPCALGALPTPSTAVVVQRMVDAAAAGVAFSADPLTGQRCVVIEATPGLGDALVGGQVTPDRYVVDGRGELIEVHPAAGGDPVLDEKQVRQLAHVVRSVARAIASPQDIEWAWDGARLWLLQTRPITNLVGKHIYSNRLSSEMAPGLIKPLLFTTNTSSMTQHVFGQVFTDLIGPSDIDFSRIGKRIHSRLYTDLTVMSELFERVGLPPNFLEMMSRDEHGERGRPPIGLGTVRAGARLLRFAVRHGRVADKIDRFNQRHYEELDPFRRADWSGASPEELIAHFEALARLHGDTQWHVFLGPVNMLIRNRHMASLAKKHAPDVRPGDLIKGLVGLKALEPNARLRVMAKHASALGDDAVRLLTEEDDGTIRSQLSRTAGGRALIGEFDTFLDEFGFLSTNGTDFTVGPWAETPTLIWRSIGRTAAHPPSPATEDRAAIRDQARENMRSRLNPILRVHFDRLLRTTVRYIDLREHTSMLMSEDAYQMRRLFLALADRLVRSGQLIERDDIFYLDYAELCGLVGGSLEPGRARDIVATRRAEMAADEEIELPDTICGDWIPSPDVRPDEDRACLVGIAGSSGIAQGTARVIHDPSEAPATLTREDILVVPFTDVGWTPLFSGTGGIVAETGGQLSHTAIVAREYGLPAVVSIKKATRLIQDGQAVTVDGDNGKVYLHHTTDE